RVVVADVGRDADRSVDRRRGRRYPLLGPARQREPGTERGEALADRQIDPARTAGHEDHLVRADPVPENLHARAGRQAASNFSGIDSGPLMKLTGAILTSPSRLTDFRRGSISSIRMRISMRASNWPRQTCAPWPKAICL